MSELILWVVGFVVLIVVLRYPPAIDKPYWGFARPKVRPAFDRLGVDEHGQIYLKKDGHRDSRNESPRS
jgi:hypothetical protein